MVKFLPTTMVNGACRPMMRAVADVKRTRTKRREAGLDEEKRMLRASYGFDFGFGKLMMDRGRLS